MSWLPEGTILGPLLVRETFVFYDGPRLFSAQALTDQLFLAVWVDDTDGGSRWLYVPLSEARLRMARSGSMSVRDAITNAESVVYEVTLADEGRGTDSAQPMRPSSVPTEWLPDTDLIVQLQTHTLPVTDPDDAVAQRSRQEHRTHLRLAVKFPGTARSEAPARKIGELIALTQTVYDNIGLALSSSEPAQRGRIPREVAEQTEAVLVGASASSFVLELASNKLDDLLGESLFARSTAKLLGLLDLSLDQQALTGELAELHARGAKSFRSFVNGLASTNGDVTFGAAGAAFGYQRRALSADRLTTLVAILKTLVPDEEPFEIRRPVTLYRIDTDRKAFGARDVETDESWEGGVDEVAMAAFERANATDVYDALILETRVLDETVGDVKRAHALAQLSPREPDLMIHTRPPGQVERS